MHVVEPHAGPRGADDGVVDCQVKLRQIHRRETPTSGLPVDQAQLGRVGPAPHVDVLPLDVPVYQRPGKGVARVLEPAPSSLDGVQARDDLIQKRDAVGIERGVLEVAP